jgi:hypothetical protein
MRRERAGQVLVVLGLALIVASLLWPQKVARGMAIVVVDTTPPYILSTWPSGTSTTPTPVEPSKSYTIWAIIGEYPIEAWVEIDGVRTNLSFYAQPGPEEYDFRANWTSPGTEKTVTFVWKAKDAAGNIGTKTTYAITAVPAGDFYINDRVVTKDATVYIPTRTLVFKFVATKGETQINRVWIEVVGHTTFDLSKQADGKTWDGRTWTAPADGEYTIYGWFRYGTQSVRGMAIEAGLNTEPVIPAPFPNDAYIAVGIGAMMTVAGAAMWLYPKRR